MDPQGSLIKRRTVSDALHGLSNSIDTILIGFDFIEMCARHFKLYLRCLQEVHIGKPAGCGGPYIDGRHLRTFGTLIL